MILSKCVYRVIIYGVTMHSCEYRIARDSRRSNFSPVYQNIPCDIYASTKFW